MGGLNKYCIAYGVCLLAFGGFLASLPVVKPEKKTEQWLEQQAPTAVGAFRFVPSADNPAQSYKMDKLTYELLDPYGIVARVYKGADEEYDTVLIAGSHGKNFHNPKVCFTGQGYEISDLRTVNVPTTRNGVVPMTLARVNGTDGNSVALFCYKSPLAYRASTNEERLDLIVAKLLRKAHIDGVFFRFMARTKNANEDKLIAFASQFMDAASISSNGYY